MLGSCDDFKQSPDKSGHMMTFSSVDCQPPTKIIMIIGIVLYFCGGGGVVVCDYILFSLFLLSEIFVIGIV